MTDITTSVDARAQALEVFGYSPPEAQFLCLAALHSGYFLRRQYTQFLGRPVGGTTTTLIEKLTANGHAQATLLGRNTVLYHLGARPFYRHLRQEDNRNRRTKQPLTIKNRLMALDFVLDHQDQHFLATEQEKVAYFQSAWKGGAAKWPSKLYRSAASLHTTERCFVEKYPIVAGNIPAFSFIDEGLTTTSRFETFLDQYGALFRALNRFRITYVAASPRPFLAAERSFKQFLSRIQNGSHGVAAADGLERMLRHFSQRQRFEAKDLTAFDRSALIRYRDERNEFSGARYDALFAQWRAQGDLGLTEAKASDSTMPAPLVGTFDTYLLRHNYDLFGTITTY